VGTRGLGRSWPPMRSRKPSTTTSAYICRGSGFALGRIKTARPRDSTPHDRLSGSSPGRRHAACLSYLTARDHDAADRLPRHRDDAGDARTSSRQPSIGAPMYCGPLDSGRFNATVPSIGTRSCARWPRRHQIFLEPEGPTSEAIQRDLEPSLRANDAARAPCRPSRGWSAPSCSAGLCHRIRS